MSSISRHVCTINPTELRTLTHPLQYARSYVLSDELFGSRLGGEAIPNLVRRLDANNSLVSLAKVVWALEKRGSLDPEVQLAIASQYLAPIRHPAANQILSDPSRILYFRPQLHTTMKFVAMHARQNDPSKPVTGDALHTLGTAVHAATDIIARESRRISRSLGEDDRVKRITLQLTTGEHMIGSRRLLNDIARSKIMYVYLHDQLDKSPHPDYLDINSVFRDATGLDISIFLEVGFGFIVNLMRFRHQSILSHEKNFILFHPGHWFRNSELETEQVENTFVTLSMSVDALARNAKEQNSRELGYDFLAMKERPLIQLAQDTFLPLSFDFVCEKLTTGIYWMIFDHLLNSGNDGAHLQFSRYNGYLFERYVADIARAIHARSPMNGKLFYADEIYSVGKGQRKTSDAVLIDTENIVLIEATASRMTAKRTIAMGIAEAFQDDCDKIIFKKAKELNRFISDLRNGLVSLGGEVVDGNKMIFPLIVAIEGFPRMPVIDRFLYSELDQLGVFKSDSIAPLGILAADELEDLVRGNSLQLIDILKAWQSDDRFPSVALSIFISETPEFQDVKESDWWTKNIGSVWNEASQTIFGKSFDTLSHIVSDERTEAPSD